MRVLCFRGTEPDRIQDIKADLDITPIPAKNPITEGAKTLPAGADEKIHQGFHDAFVNIAAEVQQDIIKDDDLPLYVTGHSLGGVLAITATRYVAGRSLGACYTFGSPKVGNLAMGTQFKTPIYRVVNAADVVPRLPPRYVSLALVAFLRWIPLPLDWLIKIVENTLVYVHFGDMRYLTHVPAGQGDQFDGLMLYSNPGLWFKFRWFIQRMAQTWFKAGVSDHNISLYRRKLRAYALKRQ